MTNMKNFSSVQCVTFDLDDTLWPCEPVIIKAEQELYAWLNANYPLITQNYSINEMKAHRTEYGKQHPELSHDVTALRHQSLTELARRYDYAEEMADDAITLFCEHRNQVSFFEGAFATLEKLKQHFKIGAITNGNADLEAIGISEHFDFITTAEQAGAAKPDKKIFKHAQNQAQLDVEQMLLVGDAPEGDVLGARQNGWHAIWFNPKNAQWNETIKPHAEIQKLSQLITLLID